MLQETVEKLNSSLFFIGVMMLVLNMWSRHIVHELSDTDEEYKQNILLRRVAIFAVCFVGTRDIVTSLVLTAAFIVLSTGLYHAKSIYAREGMQNIPERAVQVMMASQ
jgi:hypothetical protein